MIIQVLHNTWLYEYSEKLCYSLDSPRFESW